MIGVDEVGRGAWAGPLLVCAARLRQPIDGLTDSKLLSAKKRQYYAKIIIKQADIGYGWVLASELDSIGLSAALRLATARALAELAPNTAEVIIIDGTVNFAPEYNSQTLIKADLSVPAVSAASIVAKVARDKHMAEFAKKFPNYGFEKHVGYGTAQHRAAIAQYGYTPEHRRSFKI